MKLLKPRLFLSYSHDDEESASALNAELERLGFRTFIDREGILVGENFVAALQRELSQIDALVALLTPASAASEWCQAELHHAHAKGIEVLPIRLSHEPISLPEPLRLLQEKIHTIGLGDAESPTRLGSVLAEHLRRLHGRRRWRLLRWTIAITVALALLLWTASWLLGSLHGLQRGLQRNAQIQRLENLSQPIQEDEIVAVAEEFSGDRTMQGRLLSLTLDATQSQAARLSALLLSSRIIAPGDPRDRWVVEDLDWRNATIQDTRLMNITFTRGAHSNLTFRGGTLSGVVWNEAPAAEREGLTLANTLFDDVDFQASWFAGTSLVDVEFRNCTFRGCRLEVSGFSLVKMVTESSRPENSNVITDEIALVENSVIVNRNQPPDPAILDLSQPKDEVLFRGVVFDSVQFRGWIRPEWFENCFFQNSVLPQSLGRAALEAGGSRLADVLWTDQPLD